MNNHKNTFKLQFFAKQKRSGFHVKSWVISILWRANSIANRHRHDAHYIRCSSNCYLKWASLEKINRPVWACNVPAVQLRRHRTAIVDRRICLVQNALNCLNWIFKIVLIHLSTKSNFLQLVGDFLVQKNNTLS